MTRLTPEYCTTNIDKSHLSLRNRVHLRYFPNKYSLAYAVDVTKKPLFRFEKLNHGFLTCKVFTHRTLSIDSVIFCIKTCA